MVSILKKHSRSLRLLLTSSFILFYSLFPLYWALRTSLLSKKDLLQTPPKWLPVPTTMEHFQQVLGINTPNLLTSRNFFSAFSNTLVITVLATLGICLIAVFTGYIFATLNTSLTRTLFVCLLISMVLPAYSVMLPLYRIMIEFKLLDTRLGVAFIYISAFMPLAIWIMRNFFLSIPKEIYEAASLDGAGEWQKLKLVLPLALPGLVAAAIITFLSAWSQYTIPLVFASSKAQPLTVFLTTLIGKLSVNHGLIAAGGLLTIFPPLLLVIFLNRYFIDGLTKGAIKG